MKVKIIKNLHLAIVSVFTCLFFSHSAYAGTSISISSSNNVAFNNIQPSSSGDILTASDTLAINTNCDAGANVYVSAVYDGSTSLINDAVDSDNEIVALPGTTVGVTSLALQDNTWGFSITNDGTYYGLPDYSNATDHAAYSGTDSTIPVYYGVKVTNALTPGDYSGQVLYTAAVSNSCLNYTLQFDTNGATSSTLESQTHGINDLIDLSTISSTNAISKTGYHLIGWKDQDNRSYGVTGTVDVNPTDTTPVILTAQWEINTYTIAYNGNGNTSGSTSSQSNQSYDSNVTLNTNGFTKTNYDFLGWSLDPSATTASYSAETSYTVSSIADAAGVQNTNGVDITLYAIWELKSHTVTINKGTGISSVSGAGTYSVGDTVTISATSSSTYHFSSWTINSGGATLASTTTSPTTFTMPDSDVTITANAAINTHTVTINRGTGISSVSGAGTYNVGQTVSISATPSSGYAFSSWTVNSGGISLSNSSSTSFTMPDANVTITANGAIDCSTQICNCSSTVHPTATIGCKMADGQTWIYGNSGNAMTWGTFNCPSGYYSPTRYAYDALLSSYSDAGGLFTALGLSDDSGRDFWSTTELNSNAAWVFVVHSWDASVVSALKRGEYYVLCYK